jgi:hypothetical protein
VRLNSDRLEVLYPFLRYLIDLVLHRSALHLLNAHVLVAQVADRGSALLLDEHVRDECGLVLGLHALAALHVHLVYDLPVFINLVDVFNELFPRGGQIFGLFVFGPLLCLGFVLFPTLVNQLGNVVLLDKFLFLFLCPVVLNYFHLQIRCPLATLRHFVSPLNYSSKVGVVVLLEGYLHIVKLFSVPCMRGLSCYLSGREVGLTLLARNFDVIFLGPQIVHGSVILHQRLVTGLFLFRPKTCAKESALTSVHGLHLVSAGTFRHECHLLLSRFPGNGLETLRSLLVVFIQLC